MNELIGKQTTWISTSGYKKLELSDLVLRWYPNTKSLTINGEESDEIKSQLKTIVNLVESDISTSEVQPNTDLDEDKAISNGRTEVGTHEIVREYMQNLEEQFELKFEHLLREIQELKSSTGEGYDSHSNTASERFPQKGKYLFEE